MAEAPLSVSEPFESDAIVLVSGVETPRLERVCELPPKFNAAVPVIDRVPEDARLAPVPRMIDPALIVVVPV
jgi:hypothetical protein